MCLLPEITKKIRLAAWYGHRALGDDLLALCVKSLLEKSARKCGVKLKFVDLSDPREADLDVIGGGTIMGMDSMNLYELLARHKAPLIFFGTGFRRYPREIDSKALSHWKELMERASLIGVRGFLSQQFCIHANLPAPIVIGDPILSMPIINREPAKPLLEAAVVVRKLSQYEQQYLSNDLMHEKISRICEHLLVRRGMSLNFYSFCENEFDSDFEASVSVKSKLSSEFADKIHIHPFDPDPLRSASMLRECSLVLSQRLHPTALSWIFGNPCVAIDYQFGKTEDFMGSIGMGEFMVRSEDLCVETYDRRLSVIESEKETIRRHTAASVAFWRAKQESFADAALSLML